MLHTVTIIHAMTQCLEEMLNILERYMDQKMC